MTPAESETALITRLLELPPAERAALVRLACSERRGLHARLRDVAAALADIELAKSSLPVPASDDERIRALDLALTPAEDSPPVISRYKLLQKIGEGGFGVVWLAEQQEPVRRRVAVKIIKGDSDTREVIARFEAERQALALMDHPNIARVFDAGETEEGRPFVVMELVGGLPITGYCDEERLSTEARLRLFITVCKAVQHAHQKGIIHRDLKPSNIIVSLHDGVPVPKIIDFGIAKATEAPLTDKTLHTRFHAFIGTPAYTSPEQMEMGGLDVDTRSDIYSLGILLYELLAGRPPFDPEALKKASLEEMRRIVREVEPPRPSQCIDTLSAERRDTIARQRSTEANRLALRLRGELDWIVLRCLEKDRTRRYATAVGLGADVQRHLEDEPVLARPPSSAYRLHKFVRRHKVGFAAGMALSLMLVAGFVGVSTSLVRERRAAAKSAQVVRFMNDMLSDVGPNATLGRDTRLLREIADGTVRRLATDLRDQPDVAADLRDTLGSMYIGLGGREEITIAEKLLREAVDLHRNVGGAESAETANSLHLWSTALRVLNKIPEAEAAGQAALAIRMRIFGDDHYLVADTLYELAHVPHPRRTTSDMRAMLEKVIAIRRRAFGNQHPKVAQAIAGLGTAAQQNFDHRQGARWHAEALAMRQQLLGNDHPEVAESLIALGDSYAPELDHRSDAAESYNKAFGLLRKLLGDQHPKVLVPLLGLAGQLVAPTASPVQVAIVRDFVASQRRVLPPNSVLLAPSLLALAPLEPDAARGDALVREARTLLDASRAAGASFDAALIRAMMFSAWSKLVGNVPGEGLIMAEEAVKLAQLAARANEKVLIFPVHTLAWINLALGRHDAAAAHFEHAVLLLGEHRGVRLMDQAALAECYRATGRVAAARELLEASLAAHRNASGSTVRDPWIGFVTAELGVTLACEKRYAEAEKILHQALLDYESAGFGPLGRRLRPVERARSALGVALAGQGKFTEAETLVIQAFEELRANEPRLAGNRAGMVREAFDAVIVLYRMWQRPEKVAEWTAKAP